MIDNLISKPLVWVGASQRDFRAFPDEVKYESGYALFLAQCGGRHRKAKVLKGFGGAGVVEIVEDHPGRHIPHCLHRAAGVGGLGAACFSEEIENWYRDADD